LDRLSACTLPQTSPSELMVLQFGSTPIQKPYYDHAGLGERIAGAFGALTKQDSYSDDEENEDNHDEDQLHAVSTVVPFVFAHHENDSWVKVALDEEEGVIFFGRADGAIDVLEYA